MSRTSLHGLLAAAVVALSAGESLRAVDTWYTSGTPRDFTNATIWSAGVPGAGDRAILTNVSTIVVTNSVGVTVTNANLIFDAKGNFTETLNFSAGGPLLVTNSLMVGNSVAASNILS